VAKNDDPSGQHFAAQLKVAQSDCLSRHHYAAQLKVAKSDGPSGQANKNGDDHMHTAQSRLAEENFKTLWHNVLTQKLSVFSRNFVCTCYLLNQNPR